MGKKTEGSQISRLDLARRLPDVRWGLLPILLVPVVVSFWPHATVLESEKEETSLGMAMASPDYYLRGAKMSALDDDGKLMYQFRAAEVLHFPDESANARELEMHYVGVEGRWKLTAPRATAPADINELQLDGGVIVSGRKNERQPKTTMRMRSARLLPEARQLDTDSPVEIDETGRQVRAVGMTMDIGKNSLKLKNKVRVNHAH